MSHFITKIAHETCPSCGKEKVFSSKGNVLLFKVPQMKAVCTSCGYRFEKEPGYFTGAMYVSYALSLVEIGLVYVLGVLLGLSVQYAFYLACSSILVVWPFNFRMSRIIWMYLS